MNWADIGGKSSVKHVVVRENPGIFIGVLCKQLIHYSYAITRKEPIPHCLKCIAVLKKLIQEGSKK